MNIKFLTISTLVAVLAFCSQSAMAQQGIGTNTPSKASVLDMKSESKGLLIPRVPLVSTQDFGPIRGGEITGKSAEINSLLVYNTQSSNLGILPEFQVTPGYYYWSIESQLWNRLVSDQDLKDFKLFGDVTGDLGETTVVKIQGNQVSDTAPKANEVLTWDGSAWTPTPLAAVQVDNGLKIQQDKVHLGGTLIEPTEIATDKDNTLAISGLDKTKTQATESSTGVLNHLVAVNDKGVLSALKAAMPKFFYMPSIVVPLASGQIEYLPKESFDDNTRIGTLDLYARYVAQFNTTVRSSTTAPALPVLPASELHYYITYYDEAIFDNVQVSPEGLLTYRVKAIGSISYMTFMNIVFAVKEG